MTKKQFKEECSFHEYGRGRKKRNAIYFDYSRNFDNKAVGYKYMVKSSVENCGKAELFNVLYNWVNDIEQPPYYVEYKYAPTEQSRFKVSIVG